jgi:hypothetical protein
VTHCRERHGDEVLWGSASRPYLSPNFCSTLGKQTKRPSYFSATGREGRGREGKGREWLKRRRRAPRKKKKTKFVEEEPFVEEEESFVEEEESFVEERRTRT